MNHAAIPEATVRVILVGSTSELTSLTDDEGEHQRYDINTGLYTVSAVYLVPGATVR